MALILLFATLEPHREGARHCRLNRPPGVV